MSRIELTTAHGGTPIDVDMWDPQLTQRVVDILRPVVKRYFRSEVKGLNNVPQGTALLVANHSGGLLTTDPPCFAVDFYDCFGYGRPIYTLSHDVFSRGPTTDFFLRTGFIPANPDNAARALAREALVVVFPGGDYDVMRPTLKKNVIDFKGRTGYVQAAVDAGVPIVPAVSIGGQETQLFLTRGTWLARQLGLKEQFRSDMVPVSFGFPFGLTVGALNTPLPSKVVTQVLPPVNLATVFGRSPDVAEVDAYVRGVMQGALDRLAKERRLPILG